MRNFRGAVCAVVLLSSAAVIALISWVAQRAIMFANPDQKTELGARFRAQNEAISEMTKWRFSEKPLVLYRCDPVGAEVQVEYRKSDGSARAVLLDEDGDVLLEGSWVAPDQALDDAKLVAHTAKTVHGSKFQFLDS